MLRHVLRAQFECRARLEHLHLGQVRRRHADRHRHRGRRVLDPGDDAAQQAIAKASESVRNIQWFEVTETRGHVKDGKIAHWQVSLKVGFTLED